MGDHESDSPNANEESIRICTMLFWRLYTRGLSPLDINKLVMDVFHLLKNGGSFTVSYVNYELVKLGWAESPIDEDSFELIVLLLEKELDYTVNVHVLN